MADIGHEAADDFIGKWQGVAASELPTSQSFLSDLCRLLGVDTPHPTPEQDYMFERPITFRHGDGSTSAGRIDLYRRGAFVLESEQFGRFDITAEELEGCNQRSALFKTFQPPHLARPRGHAGPVAVTRA